MSEKTASKITIRRNAGNDQPLFAELPDSVRSSGAVISQLTICFSASRSSSRFSAIDNTSTYVDVNRN